MADMSVESRALSPLSSAASGSSNKAERPQDQKVMDAVSQVQERTADKVEKQASSESIADRVEEMNQSSTIRNTSLQFVFDEKGEPPVVKVIDTDNGEMIRQIPSELVVKLSKAIEEMADNENSRMGFLFDNQI
ncbi:flagellar protein FlaG [Idiomarina abyssalis]|uniref:flagellar protein FlaG n=1 Tax=Idiomarina abyssalis TaxID=86102 RepID=UPI001CD5ABA8|nr:flagellar protein FlaG [Idiomarina abyssalis]